LTRLAAVVVFAVVPLVLAEGVLRFGFSERFRLPDDERVLTYQYDEELGWFPEPSSDRTIEGTRRFHVRHNARGFRDAEHGPKQRPRLLVLGDSFVWGFDVEAGDRFTDRLGEGLPGWEVLNLGVSGYGTDQELLLLRREIAHYAPEIVLLVFAEENDRQDNTHNRRYGPYYKPYFVREAADLALRGTPVPRPLPYLARAHPRLFSSVVVRAACQVWLDRRHPALRVPDASEQLVLAVRDVAEAHGARFALAVQGRGAEMLAFARARGVPAVGVANRQRYPRFGGHWTPAGHAFVAERILALLGGTGWIPELAEAS
jgi:hypothetical protein